MLKNQCLIVFNRARGLMMVVAEHTKSQVSAKSTANRLPNLANIAIHPSVHTATIRPLRFSFMLAFGMVGFIPNSLNIPFAHADIMADQSAAANQRPIITNAANGVPLVNIQTPSAAGVSRNTYSQFDVNNQGVILNNSHTNVQTQLGGFVQGNPYLATGTARVILNEVNASNPSLLNGYVEVAGSRAQVVIANPAGISCNGCGFINANHVTLTTGTPIINSGDLMGYRVGGGVISLLGAGLDASQTDYTSILARAVNVQASVQAQHLNIVAGSNQINVASNGDMVGITPTIVNSNLPNGSVNTAPALAIDVATLGGMYAGKIHLISTEAGVGVRNAGYIGASAGEVRIDINGQLINANKIAAHTNTHIQANNIINTGGSIVADQQLSMIANSLTGDGKVLAGSDANVLLNSDYIHTSTGELQADGNLTLTSAGNVTNQASLLAGNTLTLNAANISNAATGAISGLHTQINTTNTLTNRGLIDGNTTFIDADTLNNIGTGSIFGNHLAIKVATLNNTAEVVNTVQSAAVIAARNRLDIGANNIHNLNESLLLSAGDIAIGGDLDANHQASGQAASLVNEAATIEALGNLNANVTDLHNLNSGITTQSVLVGNTAYDQFTPRGTSVILNSADYPAAAIGDTNVAMRTAGPYTFREYWRYVYTGATVETQLLSSAPAQLLAGNNLTLNGNVINHDSKIIAGGTLDTAGARLNNLNTQGQSTTSYNGTAYYYDYDGSGGGFDYDVSASAYNPANHVVSFNLATNQVLQNTLPASVGAASGATVATLNSNALPTNSLFTPTANPAAGYIIETNPRFANYKTWLSSDYMLKQLSYDPATTTKRLGDGFYEQKLIREQVAQLTGQRFLAGYSNEEAQYQALMLNGVTFAKTFNLTPGIALSDLQMAQLTSDIVWLVEQTITLPDGTTTRALVPKVYAKLKDGDISNTGALLAGNSVRLNLTGDPSTSSGQAQNASNLFNQGTIGSRNLMVLTADNVNNLGGRIRANEVALTAQHDINNIGGTIDAQNSLILNAGHDINVVSTTQSSQNQTGSSIHSTIRQAHGSGQGFTRTNLDRVAGLYVTGGQGLMVASAGNDIHLDAAQIVNAAPIASSEATNLTLFKAGNNLSLGTVEIAEQNNSIRNAKNYIKHGSTDDIGTTIQTQGDITLIAGKDLNLKAANVTSDAGAIAGFASGDIHIENGTHTDNMATARTVKKSGSFSNKKTTTRDTFNHTNTIGSTLSADNITLMAGATIANDGSVSTQKGVGDIVIKGSSVVATNDVNLKAGADINVIASQDTHDETHFKQVKQSGLSSSGASVTYGNSKLTNTNDSQQVTNVASTIGSIEGKVNINSGKTYNQTGSDVLTPQGDINIAAQQVNITAATDTYDSQQTMKYKQSGITLAVSSSVLNLAQNVANTAQGTIKSDSTGNQMLNALQTYANASTLTEQKDAIVGAVQAGNAQGAADAAGVRLSISFGSSKTSSTNSSSATISQESLLKAGGDINIKAIQDNINVIGSEVKATQNVTLNAAKDINLIASADMETNRSKNKSSSNSIGVSFGVGENAGFSVDVAASRGKGSANSNNTTYNNSQVSTGERLNLESGNDTNLIGANISGKQVIANIGSDLNIESLQDTATSKAKQSNTSVGVSIPIGTGIGGGSFSQSKQKSSSNYASVYEQTSIKAGEEGFNVNVKNNTDLKGATISSEASADKNQLVTGTLTTSNIQNHMDAKASSSTSGLSTDMLSSKYAAVKGLANNLMNNGKANASDDSTTLNAIAPANIIITDETKQQSLTGKTTEETVASLNRDTANTNRVLAKPDLEAQQKEVQHQQADKTLLLNTVAALADDGIKKLSNPKLNKVFCTQEPCHNDQQANNKLIGEIALDIFINNPGMSAEDATKLAINKITGPDGDVNLADPQYAGSDPNRIVKVDNPITGEQGQGILNIQTLPTTLDNLAILPNDKKQNSTVFANGIFNNLQRGAELAIQQTPTFDPTDLAQLQRMAETGNVGVGDTYIVHTDKANNFIGEFIVAAIGKQAEIWGIATPAASLKADAIRILSTNSITGATDNTIFSVGHSRGTMTDSVAAGLLGNLGFYNPNLQFIEDNPAAQQARLENRISQITTPQNLYVWAPSHDPVATFTGGYGNNYLGSLASMPSVFTTSNSVHSSPGTGAVGSLTTDVNKPISYTNINVEQLNQTRAQQTQNNLTKLFSTPKASYVAPQIDNFQQFQQQTQQQNNTEMISLLQSVQNAQKRESIKMSTVAYQKLMQLKSTVNEEIK